MEPYNQRETLDCYDRVAQAYARAFLDELSGKPFDRNLLQRFAAMLPPRGLVADVVCGCGHIGQVLAKCGDVEVVRRDLSAASIAFVRQRFPQANFEVDDLLDSTMASDSLDGLLCFYGIVHFDYPEVAQASREFHRVLKVGGRALFCFHLGTESPRITDFLGISGANATWNWLEVEPVRALCRKAGLSEVETIIRYPYEGREHPSQRAYLLVQKR